MRSKPGKLWIIATPIGNSEDLSPRAREVIAESDLVLAEDTRRTLNLCHKCNIVVKKIISFFDHNENDRIPEVIAEIKNGKKICLLSDAGTPLLSDPGYRLVNQCKKENLSISSVPGPSSPVAALSLSGIPPIPFTFLGFLPRKDNDLKSVFETYAKIATTLVFFERKDRLIQSLSVAFKVLGERKLCICKELTKLHEEIINGDLSDFLNLAFGLLGELTVIIGPPEIIAKTCEDEVRCLLKKVLTSGIKLKKATQIVSEQVNGWSSAEIYCLYHKKEITYGN